MLASLRYWLTCWLTLTPHFTIGQPGRPQLLRWFILPRNHICNLYLHKFLLDDEDRAVHDHPWNYWSWLIRGSYSEITMPAGAISTCQTVRRTWSVAAYPATHRHRVMLHKREDGTSIPCWTIVLTGPVIRTWGFWCPRGFVPWRDFLDHTNYGNVGRGCGEHEVDHAETQV